MNGLLYSFNSEDQISMHWWGFRLREYYIEVPPVYPEFRYEWHRPMKNGRAIWYQENEKIPENVRHYIDRMLELKAFL